MTDEEMLAEGLKRLDEALQQPESDRSPELVDRVTIESDEDGWHLYVTTDFADYDFRLPQDVAIDLAETEASKIRSWWAQGKQSAREHVAELALADAYALDDPKHPDYLAGVDLARDIARGK